MANGWNVVAAADGANHVCPIGDSREHVMTTECWCEPVSSPSEGGEFLVVVHNAADRRELSEPDRKAAS